ncbi:MAG: TetR/AcrR family transcriptional regulator [Deltaproteobacteria bacterium]|nr:TetR/AcrR family transcriptional regulator [Deltaproteobacteria bacterium]
MPMRAAKSLAHEKRDLTQKAIQKAAKKVFFQKGYANATIAEIAKLAGVAKGSIYLHFQTKDDLYLSLMLPILKEIKRSISGLKESVEQGRCKTGKEIVEGFYEHYQRLYRFDPDGIRIVQAFQLGDMITAMSKQKQEELTMIARENFQISRSIFSCAMERKIITRMDIPQLVDVFWATFIGVVQLEESKLRLTGKNHFDDTLRSAFGILAKGLSTD